MRDFNLHPHGKRRHRQHHLAWNLRIFNSRLHRRRRFPGPTVYPFSYLSTHAFTEGDGRMEGHPQGRPNFQLTPSRKATAEQDNRGLWQVFQLTPSRKATANLTNNCFYIIPTFIDSFQFSHSNLPFSLSSFSFFSSFPHFSGANLPVFFCLLTFRTLPCKLYYNPLNRFILICYIIPLP